MKKSLLILVLVLFGITQLIAQAPQAFNYQAIARDKAGNILSNQQVSIKISLLQGDIDGPAVYQETHTSTTNDFGLINLSIGDGRGTTDGGSEEFEGLSMVDWSQGPYFIKVAMDENGGSNYREMGTAELLSVPYALYADKAGTGGNRAGEWTNDVTDVFVDETTFPGAKVGIGVTNPGAKIEVAMQDGFNSIFKRVNNNPTSNSLFLLRRARGSLGAETPIANGDYIGQIGFDGSIIGGGYNRAAVIATKVDGAPGSTIPGYMEFRTRDGSGTMNKNMVINSDGNVGIGTVLPGHLLDVAGTVNANNFYKNGFEFNEGKWSVNGNEIYYNTASVGIGTTNPSDKLHVHGGTVSFYTTGGSNPTRARFASLGSNVLLYLYDENGDIKVNIHSDGTTYFNGGNVGIGTSNPQNDLDVYDINTSWIRTKSLTSYAGLIIDKGDAADNGYTMYRTAGITKWFTGLIGDDNFSISKTYASSDGSFYIDQNSNVGIGCTNPDEELVVGTPLVSGWTIPAITVGGSSGGAIEMGTTTYKLGLECSSIFGRARITSSDAGGYGDGNIEFKCNNIGIGCGSPAQHLEVYGTDDQYVRITSSDHSDAGLELIRSGASYYDWKIENSSNDLYFKFDANEFASTSTTAMYYDQSDHSLKFYKSDGTTKTIEIDADFNGDGRIITDELQITGGSDIAEPFDISSQEDIKSGMVVSIDKDSPGKLKVADIKYDRCVAGIISGAGNVKTGLFLHDKNTIADGEYLVALTGRVYCLADATYGPIEPGDLLTTSNSPGHAMKVTDYGKAQGAIIGKAMSSLEEGKGLVFVLVTLQ